MATGRGPVMWQIRRIRLDHIGPAAARFLDVTLDFTDAQGHPLDTILWLRNGGGKSTVLSLVCALIRPHRRDFLATAATGKHLEDYVLGSDTAHVVVDVGSVWCSLLGAMAPPSRSDTDSVGLAGNKFNER